MEEIFGRPSGPLQVRRTGQTLYNVIFCKGLREIEALGEPKGLFGQPKHFFLFCIKLGKRDKEGAFFPRSYWMTYCKEELFPFCNKEL